MDLYGDDLRDDRGYTREIQRERTYSLVKKGSGFTQLALDDDFIIPDNKMDAVKIIHTMGNVTLEDTVVSGENAWIKGKLEFAVLYRGDREDKKVEMLSGNLPFQEKMNLDGVEDGTRLLGKGKLEDLSVTLINSRKMGIRALVEVKVEAKAEGCQEIATGVAENGRYQEKRKECELLDLVGNKQDVIRVRGELTLPSSKPNIYQILWKCVQPINLEGILQEEAVRVTGELRIGILYLDREKEQLQWYESELPVDTELEMDGVTDGDILWMSYGQSHQELEARSDYDGEDRILGIEYSVCADITVWRERRMNMVEDLYSLDKELVLQKEPLAASRLIVCNHVKVRLGEQFTLENGKEKMMQLCQAHGNVTVDSATLVEHGVQVEGVLQVEILYITPEDHFPVDHTRVILPFSQLVEFPEVTDNTGFTVETMLEQLSVNLLDYRELEVKATVGVKVLGVEHMTLENIKEVKEQPLDMEALSAQPGMIGYLVKENETLWDIAKRYHTTETELMETNGLKSFNVVPGNKLLIVKRVGEC